MTGGPFVFQILAMLRRTEFWLPNNDEGTLQTVAAMCDLIREGSQTPEVQGTALMLLNSVPRDLDPSEFPYAVIGAIREFLAHRWDFRDDPHPDELLYAPDVQLNLMAARGEELAPAFSAIPPIEFGAMRADCDDAAILFGAIGLALGFEVCVVCVSFLTNQAPFSHTWSQLRPPTGNAVWIEGDVTRSMQTIPADHIARCTVTPVQPATGGGLDVHRA